ncbi:MAG: hypothetical protein K9J13_07030 [Saprospiraceae bacterium]|nr:hypothetical protein [Saprospiraceae bacterium]
MDYFELTIGITEKEYGFSAEVNYLMKVTDELIIRKIVEVTAKRKMKRLKRIGYKI